MMHHRRNNCVNDILFNKQNGDIDDHAERKMIDCNNNRSIDICNNNPIIGDSRISCENESRLNNDPNNGNNDLKNNPVAMLHNTELRRSSSDDHQHSHHKQYYTTCGNGGEKGLKRKSTDEMDGFKKKAINFSIEHILGKIESSSSSTGDEGKDFDRVPTVNDFEHVCPVSALSSPILPYYKRAAVEESCWECEPPFEHELGYIYTTRNHEYPPLFNWLNCTRYNPPKISRARKRQSSNERSSRQPRIPFTPYQQATLEKQFRTNQYLTTTLLSILSQMLKLSKQRIKVWYQNRRARERREGQIKNNNLD